MRQQISNERATTIYCGRHSSNLWPQEHKAQLCPYHYISPRHFKLLLFGLFILANKKRLQITF